MTTPAPLLFDLDGTLVESGPSITRSIRHALSAVGGPALSDDVLRSFIGPPLRQSFQDIAGLKGPQLDRGVELYIAHQLAEGMDMVTVYDGIPELLTELAQRGIPMAVATSKRTANAKYVLANTGLDAFFHVISGSEPDRVEKRHSIETALTGLSTSEMAIAGTVMIGDRIHDIEGAAHFGMPCIAVTWGYGTSKEYERADHVVRTTAELGALLLQTPAEGPRNPLHNVNV